MREASRSLNVFLEGKAHFATANIQVPRDWTAADCQTPLEHNKPVRSEVRCHMLFDMGYTEDGV